MYVGNIPWSTQVEDLRAVFGQYGEVEDAFIPMVLAVLESVSALCTAVPD